MRILLVEDDQLTANMVQVNLEHEGFVVTVCRDGGRGMKAIESGTYDLFIFDLMLPVHQGTDLIRRARSLGLGTPILMLTARSEMPIKVEALELGADD